MWRLSHRFLTAVICGRRCGSRSLVRRRLLFGMRLVLCFGGLVSAGRAADLTYPLDVAVEATGDILVADRKLPGVLRIKAGAASTVVEGSHRFREPLNAVWSVAVDRDGAVLVGDSAARGVFRLRADGPPEKINTSYVGIPIRIAVDHQGRIFVSDLETERIWRFGPQGGEAEEFAVVAGVRGLAVDSQNRLWTVRANPPQLVRYSPEGVAETLVSEGPFNFPHQIALNPEGTTAYIADGYDRCVWKVVAGAAPEKWLTGDPLQNPTGVAWSGTDLLVVDPRIPAVLKVDASGQPHRVFPPLP
jgi:sugar lactone lactonase YvrE